MKRYQAFIDLTLGSVVISLSFFSMASFPVWLIFIEKYRYGHYLNAARVYEVIKKNNNSLKINESSELTIKRKGPSSESTIVRKDPERIIDDKYAYYNNTIIVFKVNGKVFETKDLEMINALTHTNYLWFEKPWRKDINRVLKKSAKNKYEKA